MPRILIFSTAYYPLVGGAEVAIKEITDRISDVDFDLITAKLKRGLPRFERIGRVNVYRLGVGLPLFDKLLLPFWGAAKALHLNGRNNYRYFWGMMASFGSGAAFIANILHFWKPTPIILSLQEGDSEAHFGRRWGGLINISWRLALRNTKVLTVLSSYLAQRAKKFGYGREIKIIPNGVDLKKFEISLSPGERKKIRAELKIEDTDTALVTASRLAVKNGLGDVIKALAKLPVSVKFVIFGEGEMRRKLEKLAVDLEVSERVIFKGFVSHAELPKYLKACDIFIRPSLSEGMGNSFIEAMAARLPVIATPVGGIIDFLKEGETGYLSESQDPESLALAIKRAMADPQKDKVLENAYRLAREKYNWDLIAPKMKEIFDKSQ